MRRSLRMQILIPFLALIIAASGMVTYLGYRFSVDMTVDNQIEGNATLMKLLNQNLNLYLTEHERLVTMLSGSDQLVNAIGNAAGSKASQAAMPGLLDTFQEALKADDQLTNVYVGTPGKVMLVEPATELPADFDPTSRPWYQKALAEPGKPVWVEPYIDTATKTLVLTVSQAVTVDGKLLGVVGVDLKIDSIVSLMDSIQLADTGYVFVLDANHKIISHKEQDRIGTDQSEEKFVQQMTESGAEDSLRYTQDGEDKALSYVTNEKTGWKINGVVNVKEFKEKASTIVKPSLIGLLIVLLAAGALSWPVTQNVLRPVKRLQAAMLEFQNGKLSVRSGIKRSNEIGKLASVFDGMAEQLDRLMDHIRQTSDKLGESSQILMIGAAENTASSSEVAVTMQEIATGAGDQASIVERNAEIVQELADHIGTVEQEAEQMDRLTGEMMGIAQVNAERLDRLSLQTRRSVEATESVTEAIGSLGKSSEQIGEFISVIAGITNQTNLLALNAAIEAARAGEHGRGFGVVATEIRKLAAHSEEALARIHELVDRIRRDTLEATGLSRQAGTAMSEQEAAVRETNEGFTAINEAVQQHMKGISQVVESVKAMTESKNLINSNTAELQAICQTTAAGTEEVSASVEEQTASMEQMNHLAQQLEASAEALRQEIRKFS
jgi:methyl-accepting chemotaxis protein